MDRAGFDMDLRPILDRMREGVQILDFDGRYVYLNGAAAAHGRRPIEELIGRRITDEYPGIEDSEMYGLLQRCLSDREPQQLVNRFTYPDGHTGWFDLRMTPVPVGVMILSIDVSEQKQLTEMLHQAQKMEAMGRLASGLAHDFGNFISVIGTYSELILGHTRPDAPFRREIEEIRAASERARALIAQLLTFSRAQVLEPEVVDLNRVLEDMIHMLRTLGGSRVRLVTELEPGLPSVRVDPGRIGQVVMNLAVNARDAMPDGGTLTIATRRDAISDSVLLVVQDTGHGMDEATRARIFEPFFTTKPEGQGTGLGLSTSYGIVRQSGGVIEVESEPGRGSMFTVRLPPASDGDEPAADEAPAQP